MNPDDDLGEPTGYIECDGQLMAFWLPENLSPDDLDIEWIEP
jgi:hypothetical protein